MRSSVRVIRFRPPRPLRSILLVLVAACLVVVFVYRAWLGAEVRAAEAMSVALKVPVLGWAVRGVTAAPHAEEVDVAGVPTTVYRPGSGSSWPTLVFLNGVTAQGRHQKDVVRLARGLARVGFLVLVPDPPGLARGELTERTLDSTVAVVRAAAARPDARGGRVALFGVSVGGSLGLLAAEQPALAKRVTVVAAIAPYTDLANVVLLATTGYTREQGRFVRYSARPFMPLVIARSLLAQSAPSPERTRLLTELLHQPNDAPRPLALFRRLRPTQVEPSLRPLVALLANTNPARFARLYAAVPASLRASIRRLSPVAAAARLRAPVDIASAPHDKYFPLGETHELQQAATGTHVGLTVTSTLHHAVPSLSFGDLAGLVRFDGWAVRVVRAATL